MKYKDYWKKLQKNFFSTAKGANLLFSIFICGLVLSLILIQLKLPQTHRQEQIKISKAVKTKKPRPKPAKPSPTALRTGSNHNNQAENYAYSTEFIRQMMADKNASTDKKLVFLTFDDGVDPKMTPQILDVLAQKKVPATFFVLGCNVNDKTKPILQRQIAEGHAIGTHSFSHVYSLLYPNRVGNSRQIISEADQTQNALKAQLGQNFQSNVWRYPGGHLSWTGLEASDKELANRGIQWIDWNAMVGDAEPLGRRPQSVDSMLAFLDNTVKVAANPNVQVVLMHDTADKTITLASLPQVIQYYKDRGYSFGILK